MTDTRCDMFQRTHRTTASRDRGRVSYERATAYAIFDEAYFCHLGFVVNDEPRILPTLQVRIGDTVYIHGSTGSRPLLAARTAEGLPVCVAVTHLDGLVFGRSQFHHSANYRSAVAHGRARLVTEAAEKRRVMVALVEKVARGRASDSRPPTGRELAETAVLALPLTEVSVKARTGQVVDEPEDYTLAHWAGVIPMRLTPGLPEPDAGVTSAVPPYLRPSRSHWLTAASMVGNHVILEQLDVSHAQGLFEACADDEVYRWSSSVRPASVGEMAGEIREALREHGLGVRVPWVQRSAATGEVVGTTSYYGIDEVNRVVAIGHTTLGGKWWRTRANTEAELLLLRRAFEDLGAVRVEWRTDLHNERSQRAIERLGAVREGVLRRHKLRADGTWRDSVLYSMTDREWPGARALLLQTLRSTAADD
jgi:RimJ/RimL family protein N-acetyltransferase/nitroimidazol reductase NimA-like FMN-containing flavoprotein (pyridoxamine 5'-phosphate oxidase superfamily)